jgi:AraC-like DNA-binding protein
VEQAKTILRERSVSLIDIALDLRISSHAHFSNTFRQIVRVTPSVSSHSQSQCNAEFVLGLDGVHDLL